MQRIVIVSNRVPVLAKGRPQAGGLAVALRDIIGQGALWFGWSGRVAAETGKEVHHTVHNGVDYATVDLSKEAYKNFYVGFANSTLWPLLHFRLGLIEFRREQLEGYRAVNAQFAELLAKMLRPDDLVWVHDYHFIPMAAALRALGVANRLGFFLHIPFVPSSVFGALPQGEHLLKDLCAYDVVGFQTGEHRHDFMDSVGRILHYPVNAVGTVVTPQHSVRSIVAPIGIDGTAFQKQAERSAKTKSARRLLDSLADRKLLIGVDRLDYSKGIANRFEAFNRLLSRFSEFRQKVSFLQIAAPSREEVKTYASLRSALNRIAGDINGRHGTFDWVPLRYMSQELARSTLAGFYRSAHVGVVTPLRDGMNLVAHEYVAAQNVEDPGVLILSRFAGAASYFDDALLVNPYDPDEIAEAMNEALAMPVTERVRRHRRLLHRLSELSAEKYCSTFLKALTNASRRLAAA
jgi:trehalose 6-phosphate synthase